jgi:processive 1,2-diacylglycerol beta-glucosyltransferase
MLRLCTGIRPCRDRRRVAIVTTTTNGRGRMRVLVLTADVGEGHLAAARALAAELAAVRPDVDVVIGDALEALGAPLRTILRDGYRWQLRHAPWFFGVFYSLFSRWLVLRAIGAAALTVLGARSLQAFVDAQRADVIVSTYPAATSVLGRLRRLGRVPVVYATITDLDGVRFWSHRSIDLHLVMHDACVRGVERVAGRGSAVCVRPLVAPAFWATPKREAARRALGLPEAGTIVLVSGGGWGVGDLAGAARAALEVPGASVVCLAGHDAIVRARLEEAFASAPRMQVLGFTTEMPALLAAADVLVHSTGGVTCLEALAVGCPVVAYGAPPGHARLTARAMARLDLGRNARNPAELRAGLAATLAAPRPLPLGHDCALSAATVVTGPAPRPARARRGMTRRVRAAAWTAAVLAVTAWSLGSDTVYPVTAGLLRMEPLSRVETAQPDVGLVVVAPSPPIALAAAAALARSGAHASFAYTTSPGSHPLAALAATGDTVVPELEPDGLSGWLGVDDRLHGEAAALGVRRAAFYLAPTDGYSIGLELLARRSGDRAVAAAVTYGSSKDDRHSLRAGDVVVLALQKSPHAGRAVVDAFLADARRAGLRAVTLGRLVADGSA